MNVPPAATPEAVVPRMISVPRRWLVLLLVIIMQAFTFGTFTYSFSFWVEPWRATFGVERADVMTVVSLRIYAVAFASFLLGGLLDKFPQKLVATVGISAYAISMLLVGASNSLVLITLVYTFLVPLAYVLAGAITAIVFVTQVFEKNRGTAIGLATLGTSLGGAIVPNVCAHLIGTYGWREAHFVLGISALGLLPLIWLILNHKPDFSLSKSGKETERMTNIEMLRTVNFWVIVIALTGSYAVYAAIQFNMVPLATDLGLSLRQSALVVTGMSLAMIAGKICVGFLADKIDRRLLLLAVVSILGLGIVLLLMRPGFYLVLSSFALIGLGTGGLLPLKGIIVGAAFGAGKIGQAMGLSAPFMSIYAFGPIVAGRIRDETGSYDGMLIISLVVLAILSPVILVLRQKKSDEVGIPAKVG